MHDMTSSVYVHLKHVVMRVKRFLKFSVVTILLKAYILILHRYNHTSRSSSYGGQ